MSSLCALIIGFAFFVFLNVITGGSTSNEYPRDQVDKDVERLREIADYDRRENNGRKDS